VAKRAKMMRKEWWKSKSTESTSPAWACFIIGSLLDGGQWAVIAALIPSLVR
jgi:hypothetical protein